MTTNCEIRVGCENTASKRTHFNWLACKWEEIEACDSCVREVELDLTGPQR